jgi:hypothetical protein
VVALVGECLRRTVPFKLIGAGNKKILIDMMSDFISMKRFENFKMEDFLTKMDVF